MELLHLKAAQYSGLHYQKINFMKAVSHADSHEQHIQK